MIKLLTIVGARPQFIKSLALSRAIRDLGGDQLREILLHTGQHYDENMSGVFFRELGIEEPVYRLDVRSATHGAQTAVMLRGIERVIKKEKPDAVVVYGDTNSTLAGALAASKMKIPVAHIEAGMRSFNKRMPEELNRVLTDHVSTFLFSPTEAGVNNLQREGFHISASPPYSLDNPAVFHCGDVMYDNCLFYSQKAERSCDIISRLGLQAGKFFLATVHREAHVVNPKKLHELLSALSDIGEHGNMPVVLPLHPRTRNALAGLKLPDGASWENFPGFMIIPPASYFEILCLEKNAAMIITDSGGMQKEAYFHKKKCLVLREETEWTELADTGMLRIGGTSRAGIVREYLALAETQVHDLPELYGNGKAGEFICSILAENI
jgi:UDP-GlcNAc3NAcA epimerase